MHDTLSSKGSCKRSGIYLSLSVFLSRRIFTSWQGIQIVYIEIGQDSKLISMPTISTVLVFIHPFILLSVCHMSVCNNTSSKCKIYMNLFTNFCFKASSPVGIPTYYSKITAVPPQIYNLDTV